MIAFASSSPHLAQMAQLGCAFPTLSMRRTMRYMSDIT